MKVSRGRLKQYKILCEDEKLRNHLLRTVRYSKQSLERMLAENERLVIKSTSGYEKIEIFQKNNQYVMQTRDKIVTFQDSDSLYVAINEEITQKNYVIQKLPTSLLMTRQLVTMQRNTPFAKWHIASKKKERSQLFHLDLAAIYSCKRQKVALLAATKLGKAYPNCQTIVLDIASDLYGNVWICDSILHLSNSKWNQYHILRNKRALRKYLPATDLLTEETFRQYLHDYKGVILKPCIGQNGIGVIQVNRMNNFTYEIHSGIRKQKVCSVDEAFEFISAKYLSNKDYIIQQRIELATIKDCPIDFRIVTQKVTRAWKVTGMIVKMAGDQFIVTNAVQKLLTVEQAIIDAKLFHIQIKKLTKQLKKISLLASKVLRKNDKELEIIGFDIGITKEGTLWFFEGNKVPDIKMFQQLKDQTMYQTILGVKKTKK